MKKTYPLFIVWVPLISAILLIPILWFGDWMHWTGNLLITTLLGVFICLVVWAIKNGGLEDFKNL